MNKDERQKYIMKCVQEHYEEACSLGHEVVGVWLQGSQNYNVDCYTDEYKSDIDTKCIILPSLDDIVAGDKPYSKTHVRANNEHIDIKDIRVMIDMFKKQNNAFIEILFTDYFVINPKYKDLVDELIGRAEEIAHLNTNQALRCLAGTSLEKYKALEHPFPTVLDKIQKFGYDPKQLHHILRLNDFVKKYVAGKPYKECLLPDDPDYLLEVKKGKYSLEEARKLALEGDLFNKEMKDTYLLEKEPVKVDVINFLEKLKLKFIKKYLVETLLEDGD